MTNPISSNSSSYASAVQGNGIGSVQSLLTQIRSLMGEVDQQVNDIQGELRGRMQATGQERERLDFLRRVSAAMTGDIDHLNECPPAAIAEAMRECGIDPGSNAEDLKMCQQLGIYVDAYDRGAGHGDVTRLHFTGPAELDRNGLNSVVSNHQSSLDELTNAMQQDSTRLQSLMNRRGEFTSTISQCINAEHTTSSAIIQNIR